MQRDDDEYSFSLISAADNETEHTPAEQDTDDFEFISDEGDGCSLSSTSSFGSTSVPPDIHAHEFEHGRRYHSFKSGRYPLPNDVKEQRREDIEHVLALKLMDGRLFLSDIGEFPQKIIDIGTGTGTWAVDVADRYPSATVVGTDLSPIQPEWVPINARMFVEDCEDPEWMHGCDIDLVHFRGIAGVLGDVDAVVANAYRNIKEGGWIEFQDFDHSILCDDGTMAEDDPVREFCRMVARGMRKCGCHAFGRQSLEDSLERAGFTKVQVVSTKVPISAWSEHDRLKTVGTLMRTNLQEALGGLAAKPLIALGLSVKERSDMVAGVLKSLESDRAHRYVNWRVCFGQKKEESL